MNCPKCGAELPKNATKCPVCGVGIVRGKYCPYCKAVIPLDAQVCPQCRKSIPQAKQKKPITKRWWFWTVAAVLVIGIIGNIGNAVNGKGSEPIPSASSLASATPEETNPFLDPKVEVADVMNGVRTEKLGEWACIHMKKADAKAASEEEFTEFAKASVSGSDYKWWSVIFEDGTGIQFTGGHTYVSTYGKLDNEGCITEALGDISLDSKSAHTSYTQRTEGTSPSPEATPSPTPKSSPNVTEAPSSAHKPETTATPVPEATIKPTPEAKPSDNSQAKPPIGNGNAGGTNNFETYDNPEQQQTTANYVLNTNSMKFHKPTCRHVKKISPENYSDFTGTREEVCNAGYSPCGVCNP